MNSYLLPIGSSKLEKQLSNTFSAISEIPVPIRLLWSAENCPINLLPWLAWSLSVDEWDDEWSEESKRQAILNSINIHKHKGTISAIRRVMQSVGYGEVDIIENQSLKTWNGELNFDGSETFEHEEMHWAEYKIVLHQPITIEESKQVRRILNENAPARCHLIAFNFTRAGHRWNGEINFDGNFTFGEV